MSYGKRSRAPHGVSTYLCCCLRISGEGHLSLKLSPYYRHFSVLDLASALFTRPLLLLLVLLLSNYAGHFHPIIWTETGHAALLAPFLGATFPLWLNATGPHSLPWRQAALVYQRGATHVGLDVYQDPAVLGRGLTAYQSANSQGGAGEDGLGRHTGRDMAFQGQLGAGVGEIGRERQAAGGQPGVCQGGEGEGRERGGAAEAGAGGSEEGGVPRGKGGEIGIQSRREEASEAAASGAAAALAPEEAAAMREIVGGRQWQWGRGARGQCHGAGGQWGDHPSVPWDKW